MTKPLDHFFFRIQGHDEHLGWAEGPSPEAALEDWLELNPDCREQDVVGVIQARCARCYREGLDVSPVDVPGSAIALCLGYCEPPDQLSATTDSTGVAVGHTGDDS